jgi:pimeloyl-ACP methyl ester carboxylesterase
MRAGVHVSPPIWREGLIGLEAAKLLRDPVWQGDGVIDGRGQPVMLIPGFLAGDGSLALMTKWLRRTGHNTSKAGIRTNVDCSEAAIAPLEARLEALVQKHGKRAAIIGQSRGGNFAKVLARRRPELVSGIVTLGSPQLDPLAVHAAVLAPVGLVGLLGTLGARGFFKRTCLAGDCCTHFWDDFRADVPRGVGYVSIYSRHDGIVDWHACLDPAAERLVEVGSSHCGMAVNPSAYREIALALDRFRRRDARRQPLKLEKSRGAKRGRTAPLARAA